MKPSAFRLLVRVVILGLVASLGPLTPIAAQASYHFDLSRYQGESLTYYLVTTGTLDWEDETGPPVSLSFEFSSLMTAVFSTDASRGDLPVQLILHSPALRGLDQPGSHPVEPTTLEGSLSPSGALRSVETPPFLADLGIDMADLLLGLLVPAPEPPRAISPGSDWRSTFTRSSIDRDRPASLALTTTYTVGRPVDWGGRALQSITARIRGDLTLREGLHRTEVQEIGHGLLYLREDGVVELSSVSVITQIETRMTGIRNPLSRSKLTLTTTLELRQEEPAAKTLEPDAVPVPPAEEMPAPVEPAESLEPLVEPVLEPVEAPVSDPVSQPGTALPSGPLIEPSDAPDVEPGGSDVEPDVESDVEQEIEPGIEPALPEPVPTDDPITQDPEVTTETPEAEEPVAVPDVPDPEPMTPVAVYRDPAGRFELGLGEGWIPTPRSVTLRGTTFVTEDGQERAYVYVMPLPSPAATALSIARSALATYGETQTNFRVLVEPEVDVLDGEVAYRAQYTYVLNGERITEWALFARVRDRAYYVQYARVGESTDGASDLAKLHALRDAFRFGEHPRGHVPVERLLETLTPYVDPAGRFQINVPRIWPLTEQAPDGSTTVFTEIGENGRLTIFVQPGARGLAVEQIVTFWQQQAAQEEGFRSLLDVTPTTMGGYPSARFDYTWSGGAGGEWARRLQAVVIDDTFVAIALDYVEAGFGQRSDVFDEIVESFVVLEGMFAPSPAVDEAGEPESPGPDEPAVNELAGPPPFDEPEDDSTVILLGRILTRYPGPDGKLEEEWAKGVQVTVFADQDEFRGVTDDLGYLYVANLPRLAQGRFYTISRLDGPMLGFVEPVAVSFDNLRIGQIGPRVAHLRTLIVTLNPDRTLSVEIVRSTATAPDDPSALAYFLEVYAHSAWAPHVEEAVLSGLD